jgi:hypothetical protein
VSRDLEKMLSRFSALGFWVAALGFAPLCRTVTWKAGDWGVSASLGTDVFMDFVFGWLICKAFACSH